MARQVFINFPVADLDRSVTFFTQLGFTFNPQFTDETATCMIVNEQVSVMLLTREKFAGFMPKPVADAQQVSEVLVALTCDSRAAVDEMVRQAQQAGGSQYKEPEDHGFMYAHGFQDPDGHIWEPFWMDPAALQAPAA